MFKKLSAPFLLFLVIFATIVANFSPHSFLVGWDNLLPEFNFKLNIQRSIFSVWEEYQGLGLLAGNGHAADIAHQITLFLLSFIFPLNWLRQIYVFAMLSAGAAGAYSLILYLTKKLPKTKTIALMGSLFYLLNLSTIQTFYAPFEPFITHYAFLPWLILIAITFVLKPNRKHLIFFLIINFFATPQGEVPTVFFVYLAVLCLTLATLNFWQKNKKILYQSLKVILLTIFINAFWLLPFLYFTLSNSQIAVDAKINQMATETVFLQNMEFGNIEDVVLLKGFWLKNVDPNLQGKMDYMMQPWRQHLSNPIILGIGYLFFGVILVGIFSAVKRKQTIFFPFLLLFILSFTMLTIASPPFSWIDNLIRDNIPLFGQVFRFPFTKFSVLASLTYAIFFAVGLSSLISLIKGLKTNIISSSLFFILLVVFTFPVFQGKLFYQKEKLQVPKEYFALFDFFKKQDLNTRIANFPQYTFWGWNLYRWGYGGSGFIWYGIQQPIIDRVFDVWSKYNENYYWEISNALYAKNALLFEAVLNKYKINWLLVDKNIIKLDTQKGLFVVELEKLISQIPSIEKADNFGNLEVYKVTLKNRSESFVSLGQNLPKVSPAYSWNNFDYAYLENGDYVSEINNGKEIFYPFRSLFTGREQNESEFKIKDMENYFSFQTKIPKSLKGATLIIPPVFDEELTEIDKNNLDETNLMLPQIFLDGEIVLGKIEISNLDPLEDKTQGETKIYLPYIHDGNLEIRIPKIKGHYSYDTSANSDLLSRSFKNCSPFAQGTYSHSFDNKNGKMFLNLESLGSNNCFSFDLADLSQRLSYLVSVESKYTQGKSLLFSVINKNYEKPDFEIYLPKNKKVNTSYFIIPPMDYYGAGYNLYFDNASIGRVKTVNTLGKITVNPIPHRFLTSLRIEKGLLNNLSKPDVKFNVKHPNPSLFEIKFEKDPKNQILILSQSYDQGWKAYRVKNYAAKLFPFIFGSELKQHVLVNNWENGWILPNSTLDANRYTLVIIYWPQYLEYLGILLLIGFFGWLTLNYFKQKRSL